MKIIKQNDSAGGLIFKQNTNGKAMKQNYNYGKAFTRGATYPYIETPWCPTRLGQFTIARAYKNVTSRGGFFTIRNTNNEGALSVSTLNVSPFVGYVDKSSVYNSGSVTSIATIESGAVEAENKLGFNFFTYNQGIVRFRSSVRISTNVNNLNILSNINNIPFDNLYLNASIRNNANFAGDAKSAWLIGYSRVISSDEQNFLINNFLSNEPLSSLDLEFYYTCEKAEILDFKGTSSVCIKDFSGKNNHARILNLPVGALEDQLNYANANLFVNFL